MSSVAVMPTFILQIDGFVWEGLRLILSRTRFDIQGYGSELDDLDGIPSGEPSLFIVGVRQKQDLLFKRIRALHPASFIVAFGDERNPDCLASALEAGANAALFNSVEPNSLVSCLHAIANGNVIILDSRLWSNTSTQPGIVERPSPPIQNDAAWQPDGLLHASKQLSTRELAILERIVQGDSNKHVARFFHIAEPTVKAHVKAIFRKIGAANRTQAATWALNNKLVDPMNDPQQEASPLLQQLNGGERRTQ